MLKKQINNSRKYQFLFSIFRIFLVAVNLTILLVANPTETDAAFPLPAAINTAEIGNNPLMNKKKILLLKKLQNRKNRGRKKAGAKKRNAPIASKTADMQDGTQNNTPDDMQENKREDTDLKIAAPDEINSGMVQDQFTPPSLSKQEDAYLKRIVRHPKTKKDYDKRLPQFGYNNFKQAINLNPASPQETDPLGILPDDTNNITLAPVSKDYLIGPGDEFTITLWGMVEGIYTVRVDRNGEIALPKAGVVSVTGLTYAELSPFLKTQLSRFYSKFNISISMGRLKSVQVYLTGAVNKPGAYLVNTFASVIDVLNQAGGPTKDGTLRNIKVIRGANTVAVVDLYSFLNGKEMGGRLRLESGDSIFIPLIGKTAAIRGEVARPAIYELKNESTLNQLLELAGGALPTAYLEKVNINRIKSHSWNETIDINMSEPTGSKGKSRIDNLDIVTVFNINQLNINMSRKGVVTLTGYTPIAGEYEIENGSRVSDIIHGEDMLLPETFMDYAEVVRYMLPGLNKKIISINLKKAVLGDKNNNVLLKNNDEIKIFAAKDFRNSRSITITGEVRNPGRFMVYTGIKLKQAIDRAGGLTDNAYLNSAEIFRVIDYTQKNSGKLIKRINLARVMSGEENPMLKPLDIVNIYAKSHFEREQVLRILGEVRHPSTTLSTEVLKRVTIRKKQLSQVDNSHQRSNDSQSLDELVDPCFQDIQDPFEVKKPEPLLLNGTNKGVNQNKINGTGTPVFKKGLFEFPSNTDIGDDADSTVNVDDANPANPNKTIKKGSKTNNSLRKRFQQVRRCPPQKEYHFYTGMMITDLLRQAGGITEQAYLDRVEIFRTLKPDVQTFDSEILYVNLEKIMSGEAENFQMEAGDTVLVYSKWTMTGLPKVFISGAVKNPGQVQLLKGMTVRDLVFRAGLDITSYMYEAELTRFHVENSSANVTTTRLSINLVQALKNDKKHNLVLRNGDRLLVKPITNFSKFKIVSLQGEFKFPGEYALENGERISSVVERAGGFTPMAYLKGSVFLRKSVMKREKKQLQKFKLEQQKKLISFSASTSATGLPAGEVQALAADREIKQKELELLTAKEDLGRLVIKLDPLEKLKNSKYNFIMEDGDQLYVPKVPSEVSIMGSVRNPTSFTFQADFIARDYVNMAGGFSREADKKEAYILKVNGTSVVYNKKAYLDPGDTIIVPPTVEMKTRAIPLWRDIMTIVGQFAVTVATISVLF